VDLEFRLKAGQPARVETYLQRHPQLAGADDTILQLLAAEYQLRCRSDKALGLTEYAQRFPKYAGRLREYLDDSTRTDPAGPPPHAPAAGVAVPQVPGYQILGELGRGGMAVVLQAEDGDLRRTLAVKILHPRVGRDADLERRFLEEAQVTARLQHPGVPPVYEVGRLADGRPFLAMQLVKGATLAQLLRQRAGPAADLPRFFAVFAQVCQTLAYAHACGILHRDLKPANVMVGAFGEAQVMDWGLAKDLRREGDTVPDAAAAPAASATAGLTQAGAVLGTPAYMAPEQARGEAALLDERCDVFGLGAMLCEILTGRPPFTGSGTAEVLRRAGAGDLRETFDRLGACGSDAELVGLARACLAPDPADRPRHAGVVAERVAAYQAAVAERLRRAELERARAHVQERERRKRRRVLFALAAAVLALLLLGGAGLAYVGQQRARAAQAVDSALTDAEALQRQARWEEAGAVLSQARLRLGEEGSEALLANLRQAEDNLKLVARLDAIRLSRADTGKGRLSYGKAARAYAQTFQEAGLGLPGDPAAVAARVRDSSVAGPLVSALDDWALATDDAAVRSWALAVARAADPDPWRNRVRDPGHWKDARAVEQLAAEAPARQPAEMFIVLGARLRRAGRPAAKLLRAAQTAHPADFWLHFELGMALEETSPEAAAECYRAAAALRPRATAAWNNLGYAYLKARQADEAVVALRKALALGPPDALMHNNLGSAFNMQGRTDEAIRQYHEALRLDPRLIHAHYNLGNVWGKKGDVNKAVAAYREALRIDPRDAKTSYNLELLLSRASKWEEAVEAGKQTVASDPRHADAHLNLGLALQRLGRHDEAIGAFRKEIALNPGHAGAHTALGMSLVAKGQVAEGIAAYRRALEADPRYALAYVNLGVALERQGDLEGAIEAQPSAAAADPGLAVAHYNLGLELRRAGRPREALPALQRSVSLDPRSAATHEELGMALYNLGRRREAIAAYRRAIAMKRGDRLYHYNLGLALRDDGQLAEAAAAFREALALDGRYAEAHNDLGIALRRLDRTVEAAAAWRKAVALNPGFAAPHANLAGLLVDRGCYDEAAAESRRAVQLDPRAAAAYHTLALALERQDRAAEAVAAYDRARALQPGNLRLRWGLSGALFQAGRFAEAKVRAEDLLAELRADHPERDVILARVRRCRHFLMLEKMLPAIVRAPAQPAGAEEQLDWAELCRLQGYPATAARLAAAAFADKPALASDRARRPRLLAARAAVLAAAGEGHDAASLPGEERARLRRQALAWLREELTAWNKAVPAEAPAARAGIAQALYSLRGSAALASVREAGPLQGLPEVERAAWRRLWADVEALLARLGGKG
jgi:tetratricopeptide (TPR) repeat protein/serine/threonine protein kinase